MRIAYLSLFALALLGAIRYNTTAEPTPQHTSTVSGSSGELVCNTSCIIPPK
jgi:hypothetical protein